MAVRIRKDGRVLCAALNAAEDGDIYIDDGLHYELAVELHALVTTRNEVHMATGGEWWWAGLEPTDVEIDRWWEKAIGEA